MLAACLPGPVDLPEAAMQPLAWKVIKNYYRYKIFG
jgi:hypothetical protein